VEALRQGDIDLLGSANGYEAASDGLALSHPMPSTNRYW
jgi:two-component system sensor histidine kinase EvgS